MQPQHSCGTLESHIKIFGCTVQEFYITLSKKKCFSNALRHTLVVLEMH